MSAQTENQPLWDMDGFTSYLNVPKSWAYARTRRGAIPIARKVGKYIRFIPEEVIAWAKAGCPETWEVEGEK